IDLYFVITVIQGSLAGLPGEPGRAHRNGRILRVRRGRRRKARGNIGAIIGPRVVQVVEEIRLYEASELHISASAWKVKVPAQFRIQGLVINTRRTHLVVSRRLSGPRLGAIVFLRRPNYGNLGGLGDRG